LLGKVCGRVTIRRLTVTPEYAIFKEPRRGVFERNKKKMIHLWGVLQSVDTKPQERQLSVNNPNGGRERYASVGLRNLTTGEQRFGFRVGVPALELRAGGTVQPVIP